MFFSLSKFSPVTQTVFSPLKSYTHQGALLSRELHPITSLLLKLAYISTVNTQLTIFLIKVNTCDVRSLLKMYHLLKVNHSLINALQEQDGGTVRGGAVGHPLCHYHSYLHFSGFQPLPIKSKHAS